MAILDKALKKKDWKVDLDPESLSESLPHIPTGSIVLDRLIGGIPNVKGIQPCPGMPRGKIMQLYGTEGAGKTTTALEIAASTCDSGGRVVYIDWEHEIVPDYAESLGVPVTDRNQFLLCQPETLEEGMVISFIMAKAGVDLIVFDSIAAGIPKKLLEKKIDEVADTGQVGLVARLWSGFLPKLKECITKTNTAVIGISQVREKINTMGYGGDTTDTQGGRAWKFWAAIRMRLTRIAQEKSTRVNRLTNKTEKYVFGSKVKAKLDKCKVSSQQGNEEVFYIRQGEGFDDIRTIIEVAIAHNVVKKAGAWYTWVNGDMTVKAQGMDDLRDQLMGIEGSFDELYERIEPFLLARGDLESVETSSKESASEDVVNLLDDLAGM